jgi:hypothetical protein
VSFGATGKHDSKPALQAAAGAFFGVVDEADENSALLRLRGRRPFLRAQNAFLLTCGEPSP